MFPVILHLMFLIIYARKLKIHLKLDLEIEKLSVEYNKGLREKDEYLGINFYRKNQPHITLYATDFLDDDIDIVLSEVKEMVPNFKRGLVNLTSGQSFGSFALWKGIVDDYIQNISDSFVHNLLSHVCFILIFYSSIDET
jgi:hypothetical protein